MLVVVGIALVVHGVGAAVVGTVPVVAVSLLAVAVVLRPEAGWLGDFGLVLSHPPHGE